MAYKQIAESRIAAPGRLVSAFDSLHRPTLATMMREVLHKLGDMDFQHQIALDDLDRSRPDDTLKRQIRDRLGREHRERREPYVDILASLRKQQHRHSLSG